MSAVIIWVAIIMGCIALGIISQIFFEE